RRDRRDRRARAHDRRARGVELAHRARAGSGRRGGTSVLRCLARACTGLARTRRPARRIAPHDRMGTEASRMMRWAGWALAVVFAIAGIVDVVLARHLHDEGLLTFYFARMTADDPIAAFFLQKTRPPISALYAPFAAIGPLAFGIAHVLVAA